MVENQRDLFLIDRLTNGRGVFPFRVCHSREGGNPGMSIVYMDLSPGLYGGRLCTGMKAGCPPGAGMTVKRLNVSICCI